MHSTSRLLGSKEKTVSEVDPSCLVGTPNDAVSPRTFRGMGSSHGGKGSDPPPRPPKGGPKGAGGPKKPGCVIM